MIGSRKKGRKGFTLVEILVVVGLLGIISVIGGDILITVFRAYSRARTLGEIEKNGSYVLSVITQEIKSAQSIDSWTSNSIKYDGTKELLLQTYSCTSGGTNGYIVLDDAGNTSTLTNMNEKTGVNVTDFNISVTPGSTTYVGVEVKLNDPCSVALPTSAEFGTLIEVRGY